MAVVCLILGLPIGYFARGLQKYNANETRTEPASTAAPTSEDMSQQNGPSLDQMKAMADKAAAPLLQQLEKHPNDSILLSKIAHTYFSAHQFDQAISYAQKAVQADPKHVGNRADLASYQFYSQKVDEAISTLEEARRYDPKDPQVLWNLGIFRMKAKNDPKGAIELWQTLLENNPKLGAAQRQQVQKAIADAKTTQASLSSKRTGE